MSKTNSLNISFMTNSYVDCHDNGIEGCNPFNPDEEEFGDCLFNPDSDLKAANKRNKPSIKDRTKNVFIIDSKSNKSIRNSVNHKKKEATSTKRINEVEVVKKLEILPILTAKHSQLKIEPKIVSKPPLPPKPQIYHASNNQNIRISMKAPSISTNSVPKMKRKIDEISSANLVQKLQAQGEQLRLEISNLKTALSQEKNAVRALRAQNESESRRLKQDIKRLQDIIQTHKTSSLKRGKTNNNNTVGPGNQNHLELNRLNLEIVSLKDAYKRLEDKYQVSLEAEKENIFKLKEFYEERLTQTTLSAKNEIHRLLEELKTKEHHINQFRKAISCEGQQSGENQLNQQYIIFDEFQYENENNKKSNKAHFSQKIIMNSEKIDECFEYVIKLVLRCGEITKAGQENIGYIDTKTLFSDLVTKYDREVENILINGIKNKYPEHCFIGEESCCDKEIPILTEKPTWIIDPIDGTTNFVKKNQYFCISVGLVVAKRTILGIIYVPVTNELYTAREGLGAFLNGYKISVGNVKDIHKSLLAVEVSLAGLETRRLKVIERTRAFVTEALGIRCFGSAAITLCYVAKGIIDGFNVEGLYPWDICAGALIVKEAGGIVIHANGGDYDIMNPDIISACTRDLCDGMLKVVQDTDVIIERIKGKK